jgi:uncharacterized protein YyaL (SSP411 family)
LILRASGSTLLLLLLSGVGCSDEQARSPAHQTAAALPTLPFPWADGELAWHTWGEEVLDQARRADRPLLIYLAAPGCEGLFPSPSAALRRIVEERFVSVRVDPFLRPDLARRYAAGGWPALVAALPDGRAFAAAVDLAPRHVEIYLRRLLEAYAEQRLFLERQVARSEERPPSFAADAEAVYRACAASFDSLYGGFGSPLKFPQPGVLRFLLAYHRARGAAQARRMAEQSLDALLASPLWDELHGGFRAFSFTPDWQTPAPEKDALDQAGLALALVAVAGPPEYAQAVRRIAEYARTQLFDEGQGAFRGRQVQTRDGTWWTDPVLYADRNAALIRACLVLDSREGPAARLAQAAGEFLLKECLGPAGEVRHVCGDQDSLAGLLEDQALVGQALLDLSALSGEQRFAQAAQEVVRFVQEHLFNAERNAFFAGLDQTLAPWRDTWLPAGPALAAELYLRVGHREEVQGLLENLQLAEQPSRAHSGLGLLLLRQGEKTSP